MKHHRFSTELDRAGFDKRDRFILALSTFLNRVSTFPRRSRSRDPAAGALVALAAAGCSFPRAPAQIRERGADQAIAHIIALAHRGNISANECLSEYPLRCARQVDGFLQQRFLQLLDENSLSANLAQRRLLHLVAAVLIITISASLQSPQTAAFESTAPAISQACCRACRSSGFSRLLRFKRKDRAMLHVLNFPPQFFLTPQTLRRLQQHLLQHLIHQFFHLSAIRFRKMLHRLDTRTYEGRALLA